MPKPVKQRQPILEQAVLRFASENPQLGQAVVAKRLQQEGILVSASGVRYIWKKHDLETTAKRLKALNDTGKNIKLSQNQQNLLDRTQLTASLKTQDSHAGSIDIDRRNILIHTAAELFAEKGYDRTSMRDIASHAGLLPGSVYHHFPSKTELFLTIHREGFSTVMKRVESAAHEGLNPWDSLAKALGVHIQYMVGDAPPPQRLTGQSLAMTDHPELREQLKPYREAYENLIKDLVDALPLQKDSDRTLMRLTLLGASNWVYIWYREGGKSPQEIALQMVNMLRYGTQAPTQAQE